MIPLGGPFSGRSAPLSRGKFPLVASIFGLALLLGLNADPAAAHDSKVGVINAVGAESQYANVLSQIGGKYIRVTSILDNPNTDPHTFEASTSVAEAVSHAELVVQNGLGYDNFMNGIESASSNSKRRVIVAQNVLRLPNNTRNPHIWYSPNTMPAVAAIMAADLSLLDPGHAAYFHAKLKSFDLSLKPLMSAITAFKTKHAGTHVVTTEPVADYLLSAMGMKNLTPFIFQADVMNGVDPAPEDISLVNGFFTKHGVKVFCYNTQVVDSLTSSLRQSAQSARVPVVAVYETMPTPGYDYQSWMLAEVAAINGAVTHGTSLEHL